MKREKTSTIFADCDKIKKTIDSLSGKDVFSIMCDIGRFQYNSGLPFSYKTETDIIVILSLFSERRLFLDEEKELYPGLYNFYLRYNEIE